ncbi:exopolyphosphatase PRUNE1 isoform X2 [Nymphalis io]|uniref:exopolyphosphatase PRUNE1 isoform X2 n=1 Tax=Inachis io TaxID=171585 RepID=UPI00216807B2|nr:exopolyphosphatase PRUNE1 isoform X2 [Nymphalis io]
MESESVFEHTLVYNIPCADGHSAISHGRNLMAVNSTVQLGSKDCEHYYLVNKIQFCCDDIDLQELVTTYQTNVILVDHHVLSKRLRYLTQYVNEIIDHRPLDKTQWKYKDDVRSFIVTVGSCCTLVTQRIKEQGVIGDTFFKTYPVCADILHNVIILDTVNFSKEVNKATLLDEDSIVYLEKIMKLENIQDERQSKFDRLLRARSDVSSLTPSQLLRKDLKILEDIFVPSFPLLVKEFLQKPQALEAVTEALTMRSCNVAVLLGMDLNEGLKRDAAIISPACPERGEKLAKFLQEWSSPSLELVSESEACLYFKQMNLAASRKQYMPALNDFLINYKK